MGITFTYAKNLRSLRIGQAEKAKSLKSLSIGIGETEKAKSKKSLSIGIGEAETGCTLP